MAKMPWWKFNANDWLADSRLQLVGLAEKGLLMHMLCLMHQSDKRGYLETNGVPWTVEDVAHSCHERVQKVRKLCSTLVQKGIISCSENGTFYSKRMVHDTEQSQQQSDFGKKGGNPTLKGTLKGGLKGTHKPRIKKEEVRIKNEEHAAHVPPLPPAGPEVSEFGGDPGSETDDFGPIPVPSDELLEEIRQSWNAAGTTQPIRFLTLPRARQLRQRLRDGIFAVHWREAILRASQSVYFATKWKPSFSWFLEEENFLKVLEGNYDNMTRAGPALKQAECEDDEDWINGLTEEDVRKAQA